MANVTLQIMAITKQHILPTAKHNRRYMRGDIVCVWDADVVAPYDGTAHRMRDVISTPVFVFVHIRDVPVSVRRAAEILKTTDMDIAGDFTLYRKSKFSIAIDSIPTAVRNRLASDREITVTWTQVKNYMKDVRADALVTDSVL